TKTAPNHNLDTLGPKPKRRLHTSLHGSTECDSLFQLGGDIFTHQLGIQFRLLDFLHRNIDLAGVALLQLRLEFIDLGSLTTDNDTGARSVNNHSRLVSRSLDFNFSHASMKKTLLDHLTNPDILMEQLCIVLACIPPR